MKQLNIFKKVATGIASDISAYIKNKVFDEIETNQTHVVVSSIQTNDDLHLINKKSKIVRPALKLFDGNYDFYAFVNTAPDGTTINHVGLILIDDKGKYNSRRKILVDDNNISYIKELFNQNSFYRKCQNSDHHTYQSKDPVIKAEVKFDKRGSIDKINNIVYLKNVQKPQITYNFSYNNKTPIFISNKEIENAVSNKNDNSDLKNIKLGLLGEIAYNKQNPEDEWVSQFNELSYFDFKNKNTNLLIDIKTTDKKNNRLAIKKDKISDPDNMADIYILYRVDKTIDGANVVSAGYILKNEIISLIKMGKCYFVKDEGFYLIGNKYLHT